MQAPRIRALASIGASAVLATAGLVVTTSPAEAAEWAPADSATITPGVQMYTEGAQCTANFVYTDGAGSAYVGYAAHCAGTGAATDTNGCDAGSLPLGTKVDFVEGGSLVGAGTKVGSGTLAYSSWLSMQQAGTTDENACAYNDLALVKVDAARRCRSGAVRSASTPKAPPPVSACTPSATRASAVASRSSPRRPARLSAPPAKAGRTRSTR